jgi:NADH:ubiquinone oxidoreductase subunit 3 (subunit A)
MYHRSVNELTVSIKRLEEMGFSLNQLIVAIMLVLLGGITYYAAPLAWVYGNMGLFFFVINFILIMMILGLAFISILLLPYVQVLFLKLFLLCRRGDRNLEKVVRKNFESHEGRNTKTAMMFTIALSFLIFAGSTF